METDSLEDDDSDDTGDPGVAGVLRAVAAAPRPEARHVVARALPEELMDTFAAEVRMSAIPARGEVIDGRYRIERVIGSGGMGVVFEATHLATGRRVALKWMLARGAFRTDLERREAFHRFVREAQAAGRIKHPNVVDVYDAGSDPRSPYLAMEFLEGETLRARMDRGALAWHEALALIVPVMRGVAEAHLRGVVHRDLKPDNVFLVRGPKDEVTAKVLDFGVSRLQSAEPGEPSLTRTGAVLGTPAYMPLEQLRAEGAIDARTDVYALGVVLYEMLAARRPYVARNAADFAALIASERPTPLSKACPELKGVREAAVMKALARDPGDRHANVEMFIDALERCSLPQQSRWTKGGFVVVVAALSLVLAFVLERPGRTPAPERETARAPRSAPRLRAEPLPQFSVPFTSTKVQTSEPAAVRALAPTNASSRFARSKPSRAREEEPRASDTPTALRREQFDDPAEPSRFLAPSPSPDAKVPEKPVLQLERDQF